MLVYRQYSLATTQYKKDDYRQRNVRQFLQSALRHILASSGNRGKCYMDEKEDSMLVKRIAAYTHLSSTVYEL